jgi:selenocysteine lyase/cysteine desulfurase
LDIQAIRAGIPALKNSTYLNTGTFGPSPTVVLNKIRRALDLIEEHGAFAPIVREEVEKKEYELAREKTAALLKVSSDEIALTRSVSDGVSMIANGLDWMPGDEVVISDQEHPSGMLPWLILGQRKGLRIRTAKLSHDPDTTLQNFSDQINPRTRLMFASHLTYRGLKLPVGQLANLAHEGGALFVVDGAHAVGQFPVAPVETGCDAYLVCGHKWLLGPQGTSMAYIPRHHFETFKVSWSGWGAQEEEYLSDPSETFTLKDSARRYEFGTKPWALFPGLGAAIDFISSIGVSAIRDRTQILATGLKQAVVDLPRMRLLTPLAPEMSAGLVSILLPENAPNNFKEILWERHRILTAYAPPLKILRLSVAFFSSQDEIEQAVQALKLFFCQ